MSNDDVNYFGANPHLPGGLGKDEPFKKDNIRQLELKDNNASTRVQRLNNDHAGDKYGEHPDSLLTNRRDANRRDIDRRDGLLSDEYVDAQYLLSRDVDRASLLRPSWLEIDLGAIAHNVSNLRKKIGPSIELAFVCKADAYGHGAIRCSQAALSAGASRLAVATVEEGIVLREAGINAPIILLSQPLSAAIPYLLHYRIAPSIYTPDFALALGEAADLQHMVAPYHLALNTGMNRIGISCNDAVEFIRAVDFHRGIQLEGTFTHFATADSESQADYRDQLQRFQSAINAMRAAGIDPGIVHAANSPATRRYNDSYFDMVRCGCEVYGMASATSLRGKGNYIPAMSLKACITDIHQLRTGDGVSYGYTYRAATPTQVATIPIGYADGLRRTLSNHMEVLLHGQYCLQVGNICMDQMMIEIPPALRSARTRVNVGDEVVIIGKQGEKEIGIDIMADQLRTINYEVACDLGLRLPRIYV